MASHSSKSPEELADAKSDQLVNPDQETAANQEKDVTRPKIYREWSPLIKLLSQIPARIHRNIVGYDLNLTCVAAHSKFIALGTNAGLVYWYNRQTGQLGRLWCSDRKTAITKVSLVETVDFMVAAGNAEGLITIFQIPKPVDPNLPRFTAGVARAIEGREAEFFSIQGAHRSPVSAISWAVNGMRVFSGDKLGEVFMTEIDFITKTTSTVQIADEAGDEIVQLSYLKQVLLISTTVRAFFCMTLQNFESVPIGIQPRKVKGSFGGILFPSSLSKNGRGIVCRPKKTLYDVNIDDGKVRATILLKSLLSKSRSEIPLFNPSIFQNSNEEPDDIWRILKVEEKNSSVETFVVFSSGIFHIVRPFVPEVVASCNGLRGVLDVAVAEDEIFVLEGPRTLVRISSYEDPFKIDERLEKVPPNPLGDDTRTEGTGIESVTNLISVDSLFGGIPAFSENLSHIGDKFGNFFLHRASMPTTEQPSDRCTSPAEEAITVPELSLGERGPDTLVEHRSPVATKLKPKKARKQRKDVLAELSDPDAGNSKNEHTGRADSDKENPDNSSLTSLSSSLASQEDDFLGSDFQDGVTLTNLRLEFNENETDQDEVEQDLQSEPENVKVGTPEEKEARLLKALSLDKYMPSSFLTSKIVSTFKGKPVSPVVEEEKPVNPVSMNEKTGDGSTETRTSDLPYGPPSDSSTSTVAQPVSLEIGSQSSQQTQFMEVHGETNDGWTRFEAPSSVDNGVFVGNDQIFFSNARGEVFLSDFEHGLATLKWEKALFLAERIVFSPTFDMMWRVEAHCAWAAKVAILRSEEDNWTLIQYQIQDVSLNSTSAWMIGLDGGVYVQTRLTAAAPFSLQSVKLEAEFLSVRVACTDSVVFVVDKLDASLYARIGMTPSCPEGTAWTRIESAPKGIVSIRAVQSRTNDRLVKILVRNNLGTIFFSEILIADDFDNGFDWHELDLYLPSGLLEIEATLAPGMLCLGNTKKPEIFIKTDHVTGIRWKRLKLRGLTRVKEISSSGIYKYQGLMWLLMFTDKPGCALFYTAFHDASLHKISVSWKDPIISVASAPESLWVLTNRGQIYIRTEMWRQPEGVTWKSLDLTQLSKDDVKLVNLSIGSDAVWAVDAAGAVWMRLGALTPPTGDCVPVWIPVDGGATPRGSETINSKIFFTKVYTSASGRIVWAIDNEQNVFVREGIFPDFRQGVDWVLVSGMTAIALTVSDATVWALSSAGQVYKRVGVTENNYIGEAWKRTTLTKGSSLSATVCDTLYLLDMEGEINELTSQDFSLSDEVDAGDEDEHVDDGDWALVKEI